MMICNQSTDIYLIRTFLVQGGVAVADTPVAVKYTPRACLPSTSHPPANISQSKAVSKRS